MRIVASSGTQTAPTPMFAAAHLAYLGAKFDTAITCLDLDQPANRRDRFRNALLRCRIARIRGDAASLHAEAARAFAEAGDDSERLTSEAYCLAAARRLGRQSDANRIAERIALALLEPNADRVEAAYVYAVECWRERRYDLAEASVRRFIAAGCTSSLLFQLLGWIAIKREAYGEAGKHFLAGLRAAQTEPSPNYRDVAIALHGIALVACDTVNMKLCRIAVREYERCVWTSELWYEEFNILLCLRFCRVLEGDSANAFFDARRACVIAVRPAYRAMGELLGAALSQRQGDRRAFELQLARASDIVASVRWSDSSSEERMALSEFALIAASEMPVEARKAMIRLRSLRAKEDAGSSLDRDRRSDAYEKWAQARILEVSGQRSGAVALYREAYEVWMELGYILRAAFVGQDLYRLTSDTAWHVAYAEVMKRAPDADFSDLGFTGATLPRLTPAQMRVLIALLEGCSAKAGAASLGCAPYTFTNHTRRVFAAFKVQSRDKLRARCAKLGITATSLRSAGYG